MIDPYADDPGYVVKEDHYTLEFEEYPGMKVKARRVDIGKMLQIMEMAEGLERLEHLDGKMPTKEDGDNIRALYHLFADAMIAWNLRHEDGTRIPCTVDSLMSMDHTMMMRIIRGWSSAATEVGAPLLSGSLSGEPFQEGSIPMDVRSPNPVN